MTKQELDSLIDKVHSGTANDEELGLYNHYMNRIALGSSTAFEVDTWNTAELGAENEVKQELYDRIEKIRLVRISRQLRLWPRFAIIAAAAVAAIIIGVWFFNYRQPDDRKDTSNIAKNDIVPGKHGATITLANGKVITLSEAKSGVVIGGVEGLVYNDKTAVISGEDGEILKKGLDKGSSASTGMTAVTQRGQTYQFTLPDGTRVWLNADSKISFPSSFSDLAHREVQLSGEAYFEVFKNKQQPFVVVTKNLGDVPGQRVEVLGTHFNINSYADEGNVKTTLLEGSVRVSAETGALAAVLKPSEQALNTGSTLKVKEVDANSILDWKNGEFAFNDEPLSHIMRKLERWYNVKVVYKDADPMRTYGGSISRFEHISKVLEKLELTGTVKFAIEGNTVYVYKE
ncbi:FecR family protein [Pedobacter faecalis]|uniref:FecR family protein n=1 Tax=Pedobacter faecalis TaxID=3041495 RepID=UPI00254DE10C|nr:FecR family protein [Pedobacter sp. ELA7]